MSPRDVKNMKSESLATIPRLMVAILIAISILVLKNYFADGYSVLTNAVLIVLFLYIALIFIATSNYSEQKEPKNTEKIQFKIMSLYGMNVSQNDYLSKFVLKEAIHDD